MADNLSQSVFDSNNLYDRSIITIPTERPVLN